MHKSFLLKPSSSLTLLLLTMPPTFLLLFILHIASRRIIANTNVTLLSYLKPSKSPYCSNEKVKHFCNMHVQGCMCVCLCVHIYVQVCMQVCMRGFGGQWSTSAVMSHPIWLLSQEFSRTWNLLSRPCWLGSKPQRSDCLYLLTLWLYTQESHIGIHGVYVNAEDENQVFVIARQALFRLSYLPELRKLKFFNIGRGNPFWILSTTVSQILERYMPVSLDPDLDSDSIPAFCFLFRSEQHQTFSFLPLSYWFSPTLVLSLGSH